MPSRLPELAATLVAPAEVHLLPVCICRADFHRLRSINRGVLELLLLNSINCGGQCRQSLEFRTS